MNLPMISPRELLDQNLAADQRSALWSQVLVKAIVETGGQSTWGSSTTVNQMARPTEPTKAY
jgi:hypothetical protein